MRSRLYHGTVVHRRLRPRAHSFRYRVTAWFIDLDELPLLDRSMPGFGWNRPAPVSFHDRDHGPRDGTPLRDHVDRTLAGHGIERPDRVGLLCYPRMLGYAFNPLAVYFCYDARGRLTATLHEVSNTFGQSHTYLVGALGNRNSCQRQRAEKRFYVSPFMPMDCTYQFRLQAPGEGERVLIGIRQSDRSGSIFNAAFLGTRRALGRWSVARLLAAMPLMTFKVIAAIHYEALRLWLKRVPLVPRPEPPAGAVSRGQTLDTPLIKEL